MSSKPKQLKLNLFFQGVMRRRSNEPNDELAENDGGMHRANLEDEGRAGRLEGSGGGGSGSNNSASSLESEQLAPHVQMDDVAQERMASVPGTADDDESATSLVMSAESTSSDASKLDVGLFCNVSVQSDEEKYRILKNHWKPDKHFKFPVTSEGKQKRSFQHKWLEQFSWLAYSRSKSGAFCVYCVLFASRVQSRIPLGALVSEPLEKYRDALADFRKHQSREYHQFSIQAAKNFDVSVSAGRDVRHQLVSQSEEQRMKNAEILKKIIETLILLGRQNIPLRGHRDDGRILEEGPDCNEGNFREMLRHRAYVCGDDVLQHHLEHSRKNASYLSPDIQNELLNICGSLIQRNICDRANRAKAFAILADEVTDASTSEVLSVCIRFVENDALHEYVLGFITLARTNAETITHTILQFLKDCGLDLSFLRGQGYDGAAAMAGRLSGVQARIRMQYSKATFVHCAAHTLNLALSDASTVNCVAFTMTVVKDITTFFTYSPKRMEMLKETIGAMNGLAETGRNKLIMQCNTRWVDRHRAIQRLLEMLTAVVLQLKEISTSSSTDRNKAKSMLNSMQHFEFVFTLSMLNHLTADFITISKNLQSTNVDLIGCHNRIEKCIEALVVQKEDPSTFDQIYLEAIIKCVGIGILQNDGDSLRTIPHDPLYVSPREHYLNVVFKPYVAELIQQLSERFSSISREIFNVQRLIPAYFNEDLAIISAIHTYYAEDLNDCTEAEFLAQYRSWKDQFRNVENGKKPDNVMDALVACSATFEPAIKRMLQILATLPVTTATAERSFSTLRRLKTYLRSTMSDNRSTALALLNIHREIKIDTNDVISLFRQRSRKIDV